MAIGFTQKVTASGAGVNSQDITINGVAANAFLALCVSIYDGGTPTNATPTDDKSNTWNTTTAPTAQNGANAFINYAMNVASGNTVVTVDYGTGFYIEESISEYSGVVTTSAIDQQTSNNNAGSTTPTSGTTGTTAQADELVLACVQVSAATTDVGLDVPATTGYSNLYVNQDAQATIGHSSDYKIVASTGTQDAAWGTLNGSYAWSAKIATFKAAAGAAPKRMMLMGVG